MMGALGEKARVQMAKQALDSDLGTAMLDIVARGEYELMQSVMDLQDAADLPDEQCLSQTVHPDDRREQLRGVAHAKLQGRFREWWVENCTDLDHAEDAAQKVGVDWDEQVAKWADLLRAQGAEGSDEALARTYVHRRYGVGLEEFRTLVVEWPEGDEDEPSREAREIRNVFVSGVEASKATIDAVTAELEGGESDGT